MWRYLYVSSRTEYCDYFCTSETSIKKSTLINLLFYSTCCAIYVRIAERTINSNFNEEIYYLFTCIDT